MIISAITATTFTGCGGSSTTETAQVTVTTLAGSPSARDGIGAAASFKEPNDVTSDGTNLYVVDFAGRTIRRIVIATGETTTLAGSGAWGGSDGIGKAASFGNPGGITHSNGNLFVADAGNQTIRKIVIATGEVTTFAGSRLQPGSADGTGTAASFNGPIGITTDGTNLYVTDIGNNVVRQIVIATGEVSTLAGSGTQASTDGIGSAASFDVPSGITTDGTNLYVVNAGNQTIRKIVIGTGEVTTLAGSGSQGIADGIGSAASFNWPIGITTDGINLYVADGGSSTIRQIELASNKVTTLAGSAYMRDAVDGTGAAARFNRPTGITVDNGNLYVTDMRNNLIRRIEIISAVVTTFAGSMTVDGTGVAALFYRPRGIATNGTNLYVADADNHMIRQVAIASRVVSTLAGSHKEGWADGTGSEASFMQPLDITCDGTNLYVVGSEGTIRKITISTGAVTTLAGSVGTYGNADGIGNTASFNMPWGIATDGTNLYVADSGNYTIRKIVIATAEVTTLAGSGSPGMADGTGALASFEFPGAIATDGTNLYVSDGYRNIRKIVIATGEVTTIVGTGTSLNADGTGAPLSGASGITTDGGNLYVTSGNTIRKIVIATGVMTTLAGSDRPGMMADGVGTDAVFDYPYGITADGQTLYVAEYYSGTVRQIQ